MDDQTVLAWGQPHASLVVRQGAQTGTTFPIGGDEFVLGREEGADVSVRDPEVSRRHSRISWQSGGYYLEDLGSTNGTFLNGDLVTSPRLLQSGDTIGIGQTVLVFQMQAAAAPMPHPAATARPAPVPPPAAEAGLEPERRVRRRWLPIACGCLVVLALLFIILVVVALASLGEQLQPILDDMGIPVQLTMTYVYRLFV